MRLPLTALAFATLTACNTAELPPLADARADATTSTDTADGSAVDAAPDALTDTREDTSGDATDGGVDAAVGPSWHSELGALPEGIHGIWGSGPTDVWLVGDGGLAVQGSVDGWQQLDLRAVDASGGALRAAFGPGGDTVWLGGDGGRVFRWERAGRTATRIEAGTDATIQGLWGAADDAMWAVGGYVFPASGPPIIARLGPSGGALEALPDGLPTEAALLDVWGSSATDVWAVGEEGLVLHYDGAKWERVLIGRAERLAAVRGRDGEVVIAGGTSQAIVLVKTGSGDFVAETLETAPILNGLAVGADGTAWAVGALGQLFVRGAGQATWESRPQEAGTMWRDAWLDGRGDAWLVGDGVVARFGPARTDLPSGALVRLSTENPETTEPDVEVVEDATLADASEVVEDVDVATDAGPVTQDDWPFKLGSAPPDDPSAFTPFASSQDVYIQHGPQGGIHVEVIVRFPWTTDESQVLAGLDLGLVVDGVRKASYVTTGYPVPAVGGGIFQTYVVPVQFECGLVPPLCAASDFEGKTATLTAAITPPGATWSGSIPLVLHDSF